LLGGEEIISPTRLRLAAGICVLAASLFIGSAGGAIAWADTESTGSESAGSPAQTQGAEAPSSDPGAASAPVKKVANPLRDTLQATVQSALRTLRKLQQQQSTNPKRAETQPAAANTGGPAAANTGGEQHGSDPTTVDPSPAVSESNALASDSTEVARDSAPPATVPLSPVATVVGPVTNAVATDANVALTIPGVVASLPTSSRSVADVITSLQGMLTSITNAVVLLMQVPPDLASLLLGMTPVTAVATVRGGVGAAASAPVLATPASQWLEVPPTFLFGRVPLPDNIAPLATVGDIATTGLPHELPVSGIASPAQNVIEQTGLGSFLEHTVSAILVPASLSALAAVTLPGVGGLLIICAIGMRFGYRQAKALLAVRRAGIACFAGPGPLGVVRSGSLIALRPRASRVVRPQATRAASLVEQAA
jgi:hypothetical protein